MKINKKESIWDKYTPEPNTGCWLWTGTSRDKHGYGVICVNQKRYYAHRLSYELAIGSIGNGLFICHKCDTPLCINPDHLFVGTAKDNAYDCFKKKRNKCGEFVYNSKLTTKDVIDIKNEYCKGSSGTALSIKYGVSQPLISKIVNGKKWKHLKNMTA